MEIMYWVSIFNSVREKKKRNMGANTGTTKGDSV